MRFALRLLGSEVFAVELGNDEVEVEDGGIKAGSSGQFEYGFAAITEAPELFNRRGRDVRGPQAES